MIVRHIFIVVNEIIALGRNISGLKHKIGLVDTCIQNSYSHRSVFSFCLILQCVHSHIGCPPGIAAAAGKRRIVRQNIIHIINLIRITVFLAIFFTESLKGVSCLLFCIKLENGLAKLRIIIDFLCPVVFLQPGRLHNQTLCLERSGYLIFATVGLFHIIERILRKRIHVFFQYLLRFSGYFLSGFSFICAGFRKVFRIPVNFYLPGFRIHSHCSKIIFIPGIGNDFCHLLTVRNLLCVNSITPAVSRRIRIAGQVFLRRICCPGFHRY